MIASVASMIKQFNMDNIITLQTLGYSVDVACNFENGSTMPEESVNEFKHELNEMGIQTYHIPIPRSPKQMIEIIKSYKKTKDLIYKNKYEIIHCHSPIGGVIARLAAHKYKSEKMQVIYTAHGFHFYKGAPIVNWLFYYPIERWFARYTDVLITINKEDYSRARTFKLKSGGSVIYIPGIGLNTNKFSCNNTVIEVKRKELGIPKDAFVVTSIGELNVNKNHKVIIEALGEIKQDNIIFVMCGHGNQKDNLQQLCKKLGISDQVLFLGHRSDISDILNVSNCFVFPSRREGLGMAAIEAMAAGLPIITSKNRGTREYSEDGKTGYMCKENKAECYKNAVLKLYKNPTLCRKFGDYNKMKAKQFDRIHIMEIMQKVYKKQE